jgi:DNA-binding transcriptional LysR family regulator
MRFTLKQLGYFVAAGESGSITLGAERANISQPSISAAIQQLEQEFGVQLFVRHHAQGLSLTPAGERMLRSAKALLSQAEDLYGVADEVSSAVTGPLAIGAFPTFAPLVLPELLRRFAERHPRARLDAVTGDQVMLLGALRRAEISAAITYDLEISDGVAFEPLAELPAHALLPAGHTLAGRASVALEELAELPYVELEMPLSRDYFRSLFAQRSLAPKVAARAETMDLVRGYVGGGLGYSLISARPANRAALNGGGLAYVPLDGPARPMICGIATLRNLRKTRAVEAFEAECRALIGGAGFPGAVQE